MLVSHAIRRWRAHIPRPDSSSEPDSSWRDECPCGAKLPCVDHRDLWMTLRAYRPQNPDYAAALREAGIPVYTPTPEELHSL